MRLASTLYAATAFALLFGTPLLAQQMPKTAPGAPIAARATAGTYKVDGGHTQVLFTVNHMGFSTYTGQFTQPTGTLVLDPANHANDRVEIVFPIDKVSTTVAALDEHLKKSDFFDAAKYPEGRFVSTRITVRGTNATIAGDLTLHDDRLMPGVGTDPSVGRRYAFGRSLEHLQEANAVGPEQTGHAVDRIVVAGLFEDFGDVRFHAARLAGTDVQDLSHIARVRCSLQNAALAALP